MTNLQEEERVILAKRVKRVRNINTNTTIIIITTNTRVVSIRVQNTKVPREKEKESQNPTNIRKHVNQYEGKEKEAVAQVC